MDRALVTPADGRGFISFNPETGEGAECCCGGGDGLCCLALSWQRCTDGVYRFYPAFGKELIESRDHTITTVVDRFGLATQYTDTDTLHAVVRLFGLPQPNNGCHLYGQCIEFTNRIVRVWREGPGHQNGDTEVLLDVTACESQDPYLIDDVPTATGSCYYPDGLQTGGQVGCNGSYGGSGSRDSWFWNIQCSASAFASSGTQIYLYRPNETGFIEERRTTQFTRSIVSVTPCDGGGSLTGPGPDSGTPIDPGIAEFLRRQRGCEGCGG